MPPGLRAVGAGLFTVACASRVPPVPDFDALSQQLGRPVRADCDVQSSMPCQLEGDFDADGHVDVALRVRAEPCTSEPCARGIAFLFADGETDLLGIREMSWTRTELDEPTSGAEPVPTDLSWIERWERVPWAKQDGTAVALFRMAPAADARPLALPELAGDALFLSSGDSAILVYRARGGWRYHELGY